MTDVEFADAGRDDLAAIVGLLADDPLGRTRERAVDPLPDAYLAAFEAIAGDPRTRLIVARQTGRVVGTMQVHFLANLSHLGGERCQIEGVRIARGLQGQGLGRQLIGRAIDMARERGCLMVQLTTDASRPEAMRFYEGLGFRASHVGMKLRLG